MAEFKGCTNCIYLEIVGAKCKAYPKGIPPAIAFGSVEHREVRTDQEGEWVWTPPPEKR